jgi:hypothetical protein
MHLLICWSNGPYLDNLNIDHFIGNATIVKIELIDVNSLKSYKEKIKNLRTAPRSAALEFNDMDCAYF